MFVGTRYFELNQIFLNVRECWIINRISIVEISVADPGCLSRIPDPDFYPSRIPDPGSQIPDLGSRIPDPKPATKERGEKKIFVKHFFVATNFKKCKIIFFYFKKKIWAKFQRIMELFTQKVVTKISKIWVWDPGSGLNPFRIPDPGSRSQKGTGSQIPDPQHW